MRLKCIKLVGFKSFVDPTTINFPSNLGAVVGPNGCGKSNVIDAVRWVMGESSAKNLRGEHMTDVIFNGSSARKPVGQASVELVFDNHDRKLTGEYANFSEVSIKRKVDRESQSTYALNGTTCRRRDVTDIFLGTGLGARSYSIIEQGMVSRLIESKPEELRVFIEEAAGISKYKERRRETERRIKRTKQNLERLADIREELQRQLQNLKRQSVAAEKYGELKQQERNTTANLNALRWRSLDEDIKINQESVNNLEINIESTVADQRSIDAKVEKHLADNSDLTDALGDVQARFYSLGNDIARIEQSIEHHLERVDQLKLDLTETEDGWTLSQEELNTDLRKITQLDAELKSIAPQLDSAERVEVESSKLLTEAEGALQCWQEDWDKFNQRAEEPRQIAEVEQSRIQQLENIVDRGLLRKKRLEEELAQLRQTPTDIDFQLQLQEVTRFETEIDQQQQRAKELVAAIDASREALNICTEELDSVRSKLQTSKGKHASLESLQQAALGQDNLEINNWLKSRGLDNQIRLAESLRIDSGWEMAAEAVLGDILQSICIEDLGQIDVLLSNLPKGKLSLLDISKTAQIKIKNQTLEPLTSKVSSKWDISDLLRGVYVADDLDDALRKRTALEEDESIITREGIWIGANWIQIKNKASQDSIVERRGLIIDLLSEINISSEKSEGLLQRCEELRNGVARLESEREQLQSKLAEKSKQLGEMKSVISAQQAKGEQAETRKIKIKQELEELSLQLTSEEENTSEARARLQAALDSMADDVGGREELEKAREATQKALETIREKSSNDKNLAHKLALEKQALEAQLQSTRETMDRMASQVQRSKERIESLSSQILESDQPLGEMRIDLEGLLGKQLEVEKELGFAKSKVDENEHTIRELEQERNQHQEKQNKLRELLMESRLKSEGASVKRDALLAQLKEAKYELDQVLKNMPEGLEESQCEQDLDKLSNRIQRLGPINLTAIDEYDQQSERKIYLDRQNEDLERALNTLQNAIRKIDKETRTRFKETFDKINTGLQSLFPRVFGGGHAYLDMTGEDLLDTGVAIMARPPGKRNSTIHLLSGGEKAMTAIALVFSIFHLNPSPFCMLDEVDAPLDDANVGRYAKLVKEMAETVQFIFITHNKITMEMANQLLGVTMHEAGVSRIVAVDIDEASELATM
ncbi:MAG: chromosome segregation protein SMC [Gammaproteobacteria bacterium]|nr:chromosome segregation protein SMC [Gammaproteobacteria bacterium]